MELLTIVVLLIVIILAIVSGVLLACILSNQRCTLSIQQRTTNHELTKAQQEKEQKQQKSFSSKLKRAFDSSEKFSEPLAPVEDVKTTEITLKLSGDQKELERIKTIAEPSVVLLPPKIRRSQAQRDELEKKRQAIKAKYHL